MGRVPLPFGGKLGKERPIEVTRIPLIFGYGSIYEPLQILFENGVVGLTSVFVVVGFMLKNLFKKKSIIFSVFCVYLFTSLLEMPLRLFVTQLLGICILAIAFQGEHAVQPETKFKIKVQKRLKEEFGPNAWVIKVQQLALLGVPDLLGCVNGHFFAFELKNRRKEKPSRLQAWCLQAIDRAEGISAELFTP